MVATEELLEETLFGARRTAEVLIGEYEGIPAAFALFFHNFSTFLGRPGIYLEDLFVKQSFRGKGLGKCMLTYLGHLACERGCGRLEWWVLDWNTPAIDFYKSMEAVPMDEWTVFRITGDSLTTLGREFTTPGEGKIPEDRVGGQKTDRVKVNGRIRVEPTAFAIKQRPVARDLQNYYSGTS